MEAMLSSRTVLAWFLPSGWALLALLLAGQGTALAPRGALGDPLLFAVALVLLCAAALHRPLGGATLGLGTVALPGAIVVLGPLPAAWLAAGGVLAAEFVHRALARSVPAGLPERRRFRRAVEAAAAAALATLAGASAWTLASPAQPLDLADPRLLLASGLATLAYLLLRVGLHLADLYLHEHRMWPPARALAFSLSPLILDGLGWVAGVALAVVASGSGLGLAGAMLAALALLALEAFRNHRLRGIALERLGELQEISRAGQRMSGEGRELRAVAEHLLLELARVLPFTWFSLELADGEEDMGNWAAGPDRVLYPGLPRPGPHPPVRLGIHRRAAWRVLEYPLESAGKALAHLRLWCDPRRLAEQDVELLVELLPQLASSLDRALLDRLARRDPLTGVAMRRVFERRLRESFEHCRKTGDSLAVILCDLDHFKHINDIHGHAAGDAVLIAVARLLEESLRNRALAASGPPMNEALLSRYGGEEFIVLVPSATGPIALAVAEHLRRAVADLAFEFEEKSISLTLSAGVAASPELYVRAAEDLPPLADGALYEAKRRGRNRCFLDRGRGRYQDPAGEIFTAASPPRTPPAPRIFA